MNKVIIVPRENNKEKYVFVFGIHNTQHVELLDFILYDKTCGAPYKVVQSYSLIKERPSDVSISESQVPFMDEANKPLMLELIKYEITKNLCFFNS
jgi:hypothetical protein